MTMRVADAILLGSTTMKCRAGGGFGTSSVGCALEFALAAVGQLKVRWAHADEIWTWLNRPSQMPCRCDLPHLHTHLESIWHLFDSHVMDGFEPCMTLEQLCDWVDSIDPTPRCEPQVQEPSPVETRQESTVSHD